MAAGLPRDEFDQVSILTNNELERWSRNFKVSYYTSMENDGIKLRSPGSVAWNSGDND